VHIEQTQTRSNLHKAGILGGILKNKRECFVRFRRVTYTTCVTHTHVVVLGWHKCLDGQILWLLTPTKKYFRSGVLPLCTMNENVSLVQEDMRSVAKTDPDAPFANIEVGYMVKGTERPGNSVY